MKEYFSKVFLIMVENLVFFVILHQGKAVGLLLVQAGCRLEERLDGNWFLPGMLYGGCLVSTGQMLVTEKRRDENKIMFHVCFTQ